MNPNAVSRFHYERPPALQPASTLLGIGALILLVAVGGMTRPATGWVAMWAMAGTEFLLLKLATLRAAPVSAPAAWVAAYLVGWPGMNAVTFLRGRNPASIAVPRARELSFAFAKFAAGLGLTGWAAAHAAMAAPLLVGWAGMLGIVFTLHFGLFHLVSWTWRRVGVNAPPLMRAPIAAKSLAEFWGARWNVAFAESARKLVFRPLARRWDVGRAGAAVFLLSGIVHETVVSLPARGGYGGPTLYFLLQAAGIAAEKSTAGRRLGLGAGARGRLWTLGLTALPLPLLFHAPFVERVIVPLFRFLNSKMP